MASGAVHFDQSITAARRSDVMITGFEIQLIGQDPRDAVLMLFSRPGAVDPGDLLPVVGDAPAECLRLDHLDCTAEREQVGARVV